MRAAIPVSRAIVVTGTYDRRMQQLQPAGYYVSKPPKWLWMLPVFSMGMLAFVPPIAIAAKAKTRRAWLWACGFAATWLVGFMLVGTNDSEGALSDLGLAVYFAAWIGAVIYALVMGPKVHWPPKGTYVPVGPPPQPPYDPNSAAVAGVHAGRAKREEARAIAGRDPQMARDLRIGRPDLPRQYDDGGLVDVNSAPAEVLRDALGLTGDQATQVVDARQHLNRFEHPDDLINLAGLEPSTFDTVRDRIILL
jgi:hypothetical protein